MVSFLDDTLMQKYVALKPSSIVSQRVELWLGACLEEEYSAVKSGLESSSCLSEILQSLYRHTQFTKVRSRISFHELRLTMIGSNANCVSVPARLHQDMGRHIRY
jgi:hypothetical protein